MTYAVKHDRLCLQEITNYAINGKQEARSKKRNEFRDLNSTYVKLLETFSNEIIDMIKCL